MQYDVSRICPEHHFSISGVSYIGAPVSGTAMYITCKISDKIEALRDVENCLVFVENGICVSRQMKAKHAVICTDNPQFAYARLALELEAMQKKEDALYQYHISDEGYYVSENARIEAGAYIEPGCMIGHHVTIGRNAVILKGAVIKNAIIGDDFYANEYAAIGSEGFTIAADSNGNKIRIPSLGKVRIGNNAEAGVHNNISRGSCGETILENNVKLDAFVHIGHDARIMKNVELTAGVIVGGFAVIKNDAFIGINAAIRNRIEVGNSAFIGMGSVVTKNIGPEAVAAGNPAKKLG